MVSVCELVSVAAARDENKQANKISTDVKIIFFSDILDVENMFAPPVSQSSWFVSAQAGERIQQRGLNKSRHKF